MFKFWRKHKSQEVKTAKAKVATPKTGDDWVKELQELTALQEAKLTRFDQVDVALGALIKLHPEILNDPEVIAYNQKVADYLKERE